MDGALTPIVIFLGFIGFMYWFIIRPQREQQKKAREMLEALSVGDEVITIGGLHGTVVEFDEETVTLKIASGVEVVFDKPTIGKVVEDTDEDETPVGDDSDE